MLRELRKPLMLIFLAVLLIFLFLWLNPQFDLKVSGFFFREDGFLGSHWRIAKLSDYSVYVFSSLFVVLFLYQIIRKWSERGLNQRNQKLLYFLLVMLLGAVIIVQNLKFTSERPRPYSLEQFGGSNTFVPVLKFQDTGITFVSDAERSFPSGHTAGSFALISLAVISQDLRTRRIIFWGGFGYSIFAGMMRIAEGNHFISDVTGAMVMVSFLMLVADFLWERYRTIG